MNIQESYNSRKYLKQVLYNVDSRLSFGESDLEEFRKDMATSRTGRKTYKSRKRQQYKTWEEGDVYIEYSSSIILSKYSGSTHPLINATLANALINSGQYEKGLSFLSDALLYSTRFPNLYWNSEYGMFGCSFALWTLVRLLGRRAKRKRASSSLDWEKVQYQATELLYMTMTRAIDMAPQLPQTCDLLSNRADLFWPNYEIGLCLFANAGFVATNMEIQFLSDKYRAYRRASKIDPILGGLFCQMSNEARMMYQYGELQPIYSDTSPKEIEDATFEELVERGYRRGDVVALKAYEKFRQNELGFSFDELEDIIIHLRRCNPDDIFAQLFYVVEKSFNECSRAPIKNIFDALDSVKKEFGKAKAYKLISNYLRKELDNNKFEVDRHEFLDSIIAEYKKVSRNYYFPENIAELSTGECLVGEKFQ